MISLQVIAEKIENGHKNKKKKPGVRFPKLYFYQFTPIT